MTYLVEKMSFDQLFRVSDPKRVERSHTVHGPPLEIDSFQDAVYYAFNFKSNPSTTGLRHRGYIKFFKPRRGNTNKPLQHLDCLVDCTCPDYKYRWAWANKQRGSGRVGTASMNQAWNRAPRITNPGSVPGLCKHVLAAREYIYGLLSSFPKGTPSTAMKLDKLTRYAQKRWANFPDEMRKARERDARIAATKAARNAGQPVATVPVAPKTNAVSKDPNLAAKTNKYKNLAPPPLPPQSAQPAQPKAVPLAVPPEERGMGFSKPVAKPSTKSKGSAKTSAPFDQFNKRFMRRENLETSTVVKAGQMKTSNQVMNDIIAEHRQELTAAQRIVEQEIEQLEQDAMSDSSLPPSEPPVSDTAIGADTEGETALSLLRDMSANIARLADVLAPLPEEGAPGEGGEGELEGGGAPPPGAEAGGDDSVIPEPADDAAAEEGEAEPSPAEEEEEEMPDRRPEQGD